MSNQQTDPIWTLMGLLWKAHPWHGIPIGENAPSDVNCFIEMTPGDTVKYEIDKETGHLKVDRPQKYSNICPALYGFIPQTYCGDHVGDLCAARANRDNIEGDGDPLDVCVLAEKSIDKNGILINAKPIGGLRMIDGNEADDKIIAVMKDDAAYGDLTDISECPNLLIDRLRHYFLTYKQKPGEATVECEITEVYGRDEALDVIHRSQLDYREKLGDIPAMLTDVLHAV